MKHDETVQNTGAFHKEFGFLDFSRETPPPPIKRLFDVLWNDPANDPREHSQNIISP